MDRMSCASWVPFRSPLSSATNCWTFSARKKLSGDAAAFDRRRGSGRAIGCPPDGQPIHGGVLLAAFCVLACEDASNCGRDVGGPVTCFKDLRVALRQNDPFGRLVDSAEPL